MIVGVLNSWLLFFLKLFRWFIINLIRVLRAGIVWILHLIEPIRVNLRRLRPILEDVRLIKTNLIECLSVEIFKAVSVHFVVLLPHKLLEWLDFLVGYHIVGCLFPSTNGSTGILHIDHVFYLRAYHYEFMRVFKLVNVCWVFWK